jgi:hypothetical protein
MLYSRYFAGIGSAIDAPGYYPQAAQNKSFAFSLAAFVAALVQ